MTSVSSLITQILPLPPSCIVFCPTQPDIFVVGTYFLHKSDQESTNDGEKLWQERSGSLIVFRIADAEEDENAGLRIIELCTLATESAVLDVQWSPHREPGKEAVAVATSHGIVELYTLNLSADRTSATLSSNSFLGPIIDWIEEDTEEPERLALSLAWHPTQSNIMAATFNTGEVMFCETDCDFVQEGLSYSANTPSTLKHSLEAWTAAFSPVSPGLFSGGDDCALRYVRWSWGPDGPDSEEASWQDTKLHSAGVTAILPLNDQLIVTGSYDDHVRLIYAPPVGRRRALAERHLEGGVWRLKMIESDKPPEMEGDTNSASFHCTILASCMHAGTRVLRLRRESSSGEWQFEVIARFTEHESMNYGSDVQPFEPAGSNESEIRTVVSTSFYDKRLCVWRFDASATEPPSSEVVES